MSGTDDNFPDPFEVQLGQQRWLVQGSCPHRGGKLRYGRIMREKGCLTCPLHQAVFDIRSGRRLGGPPCDDIVSKEVSS